MTLTEGEGYTISACEGNVSSVKQGGSFSFTVTVSEGYEGTPVVKVGDDELAAVEGVYTIENITADQTVTVSGITKQEVSGPVAGDLSGDGEINITDAGIAYAAIKGTETLDEEQKALLDVNGDGKLNVTDAGMIYALVKGTITSFPQK